jgi:hypothetical protein
MATRKTAPTAVETASTPTGIPVLVTTDKRGVFFGFAEGDLSADPITLRQAQNCIKWSEDVRGVFGLAATGPTKHCRVGPVVPSIQLRGITSVSEASPKAVAAWKLAPWA